MLTSAIIQQINNQSTQIPAANTTMVTTPVAPQNSISWDPDPKQKVPTPPSTPKKEKPKEKAKPTQITWTKQSVTGLQDYKHKLTIKIQTISTIFKN
jgi:hypothetical protein